MVELQIISKILETGDFSIIEDNLITDDYFKDTGWEDEFLFIKNYYQEYGTVPDKSTFLHKFKDRFKGENPLVDTERTSNEYLVDTIREEYQFRKLAPVVDKIADIANTDANKACEYMLQAMKDLQPNYRLGGIDIIANGDKRLENYKDRVEHQSDWYFSSGFPELDTVTHGIQRGEEFIVIFARINQGKSWILEKMITHIWCQGFNVAYISPEMGDDSIGYRFDTLFKGYPNRSLMWGTSEVNITEYENHISTLKNDHKNKFIVATPEDFNRKITVSKLRTFIKQHKLDAIAVDGIKYMTDERGRRNDSDATALTNISADLMSLSVELKVPILVVHQANRQGVIDNDSEGTPGMHTIKDSDGIGACASKVFSLRQKDGAVSITPVKQRNGPVGDTFKYLWNINIGEFIYTADNKDYTPEEKKERRERKKNGGKDVF